MVGRARRPAISFDMACRSCWSWVRWSERREEGLSIRFGRVAASGGSLGIEVVGLTSSSHSGVMLRMGALGMED
jgi:predicted DCC family thiol-disulfide oxidoreductase YuxK